MATASSTTEDRCEWNEEKSLQLIKEYRARPLLWDKNSPFYYNKQMRPDAWEEIGKAMKISPTICKHKMTVLMSSYRREKAKIMKSKDCTTKQFKSNWFAFKEIAFIREHHIENTYRKDDDVFMSSLLQVKSRPIKRQRPRSHSINEEINALRKKNKHRAQTVVLNSSNSYVEFDDEKELPILTPLTSIAQTVSELPTGPQIQDIQPTSESEKEINSFTTFIAMKMKNFSQTTKNAVQKEICEIIFKADQGFYEQIKEENHNNSSSIDVGRFHVDQPSFRNETVIKTYFSDDE